MHPAKERIAAVFGDTQGSGYLLTPRVVLTAAHVVGGCAAPRVIVPGGVGQVGCRVVWARDDSRRCDAALLVAERDVVPEDVAAGFEPLVWGRAYDLRTWAGAQAIGFPQAQRDGHGELDTEQLLGTLKPGSNLLSGRHVLDCAHGAPEAPGGGGSPWAGMSGAGVFVEGLLAGVVCADPAGWRHGRLTVTPSATLWADFRFLSACLLAGHKPESRSLASPRQLETEEFERRFRDYVIEKSGELTIIGLTLSDGEAETWPLDTAYLSLELVGRQRDARRDGFGLRTAVEPPDRAEPTPRRAEEALAGHRRVLLRGAAGSGKTTLLQWLATVTARGDLPPGLGHLSGCLPLLLPLRNLVRGGEPPQPEEFLAAAARPLAGLPAAQGWVTRRLTEGTVLLLIDGVDEVPEADRRRTLAWVKDLLAAYPEARYMITTRPSAVREGWLADAGFVELELLPMGRADVLAFIDRWHTAAGQSRDERLRGFRDALAAAVVTKRDLGRLATNPLMCALICALNRSRRGYLPHGRMELYRAALDLLLIRRDRERDIAVGLEGPELEQAQPALLQKIAYWLIRNGRSQIEWHKAVEILDRALPAMPAVAARGSAEEILRHLVLRSGLLRQPTTETLDFIHRTFQDFLGAQAAVDDWDFDLLVNNAHDDQWEDVLRMAVGHAPPRARGELLRMLLDRGEREAHHRHRLRLLAAACLEHATEIAPDVRDRVERAAAELVPPRDTESAKALAEAGQVVLDLLPGPEGLGGPYGEGLGDEVAHAVVVTATAVADDRAIPLLARYARHPFRQVRAQLAWSWDNFDTRHYADAVIGELSHDDGLAFVAKSVAHLRELARLGGRPEVWCRGVWRPEELREAVTPVLRDLSLREGPEDTDLRFLRDAPPLRSLRIADTRRVTHLGAVPSGALERLRLSLRERPDGLERLPGMARLRSLHLDWLQPEGEPPALRLPPGLEELVLGRWASAWEPEAVRLEGHPCLRRLSFEYSLFPADARAALATLRGLHTLSIMGEDPRFLEHAEPLPRVRHLSLGLDSLTGLSHLPSAYPCLKVLTLHTPEGTGEVMDLSFLRELRGVEVYIKHSGPVANAELLTGYQETMRGRFLTYRGE
ncbi:NACHT domain-containing protein [Streptomyces mobaraensis NBRC 13819 = DSM 40847]|uniref:NACHT domain-containing protein n=1 Tax=Streptomyces mobaraensis TaxID=35621 RepID=A0A5N5W3I9_STRMB|nr:serine protease [Streptomyces mobaraensis]KAB7837778.1 NACHT domain-containing protein [Streptomyces mobaraensis]QTT74316.1 NACHT domain-containing protein [Streptomyces mobaraensis NBRC 13819 = DSM 40847]